MSVYTLNHSELPAEIARLEWQHSNLLVPVMGNCLVPPEVEAHLKDRAAAAAGAVAVADVGTGTGVWLADLASSLPPAARLDGFDYDTSKFRPPATLPPNVRLQHADALQPFPPALHGQYDLVHVRLLVLGLGAGDWQPIAEHLLALLRPGGYLVWEEVDFQHFQASPPDSAASDIMNTMLRFSAARGQTDAVAYPIGLDALFRAVGYAGAGQTPYKASDTDTAETAALFKNTQIAMYTITASYLQGMVEAGGFEAVQTKEDAARLAAQVKQAFEEGSAKGDFWFWRTVGRKPAAEDQYRG